MSGPDVIEIRPNHHFDERALDAYLRQHLPEYEGNPQIRQFAGGQSNPTFLLATKAQSLVLRKKPPGKLLPSAHQVEREYRVYRALADTDVPVPKTLLLCSDEDVIGTPFYVMEYVPGRVFPDARLAALNPATRRTVCEEMIRVLATLHNLDYGALGLGDFGKPGNYFARQIGRWTKQYKAAQTEEIESMNGLIEWLPAHAPADDATTIVHGDFRIYNLIFDPKAARISAVIDWELSTLGHPLADLAYHCMKYHPAGDNPLLATGEGCLNEDEVLNAYCLQTGRQGIDDWNFYLVFSFFRLASIVQGVYRRGLEGNASSGRALEMKDLVAALSERAWQLAMEK